MNNVSKWDLRFMEMADLVAGWSKDPNKGVGSVIARGKKFVSLGFNGIPSGIEDDPEILHSADKNLYMSHAERNAIDLSETSLEGCTLYASFYPCNECAKSIAQKGITRVVTRRPDMSITKYGWQVTEYVFNKKGIEVVFID